MHVFHGKARTSVHPVVAQRIVRCVEVIGEAARLVSEETRLLAPGIPWPLIVGMRHVLAHEYGVVNLEKVHDVASRHLEFALSNSQTPVES